MKYVIYIVGLIIAGIALIAVLTDPRPHRRADIDAYAEQLFAFGSIRYVHGLESDHIIAEQALFDSVAAGVTLDAAASCIYRRAYWNVLQDYAKRFQFVDDDLHMATDFGSTSPNNCADQGITGTHDLHDMSAKQNFDQLVKNLTTLKVGTGWFRAIVLINEVNKNLVDLTVHFAPATHSIGVQDPAFVADNPLSEHYNTMQMAFKSAQFAAVNTEAYWADIDTALSSYSDIVFQVQNDIAAFNSPIQRRLAGRWLSLQTVAPRLDKSDCVRPRSGQIAPACD